MVYLKNGSVIRGEIVEQILGKTIKIETMGKNVFVYSFDEIEKITKEENNKGLKKLLNEQSFYAPKQGYKGFVELGIIFGTGNNGTTRLLITTTHGVQLNPNVFIGAGLGINFFTDVSLVNMPVFVNVRGILFNQDITSYADLKVGYSAFDVPGFYFVPSIGVRFGLNPKIGISLGLSYEHQGSSADYVSTNGIGIRVGLDF